MKKPEIEKFLIAAEYYMPCKSIDGKICFSYIKRVKGKSAFILGHNGEKFYLSLRDLKHQDNLDSAIALLQSKMRNAERFFGLRL